MYVIRNGCFETNSSSSHSIVVRNDSKTPYNIISLDNTWIRYLVDKNNNLILNEYELQFGRSPFKYLSTFVDKLRYVVACNARKLDYEYGMNTIGGIKDELLSIVQEICPEVKQILFEGDLEPDPEETCRYTDYQFGHVDEDILNPWLSSNNVSLRDFLLNDKYHIVCDGDEYNVFDGMIKSGIIDLSVIENKQDFIEEDIDEGY